MYALILLAISFGTVFSFPYQQPNYENVPRCAQPPASGLCLAYFPSFYYNPSTETCESFVFGGCQGNDNRFVTKEACLEACGGFKLEKKEFELRTEPNQQPSEKVVDETAAPESDETESKSSEEQTQVDPCELPSVMGPCRAMFPRFYFNGDKCETFMYGGCQGNENNFKSVEECQQRCGGASAAPEEASSSSEEQTATGDSAS